MEVQSKFNEISCKLLFSNSDPHNPSTIIIFPFIAPTLSPVTWPWAMNGLSNWKIFSSIIFEAILSDCSPFSSLVRAIITLDQSGLVPSNPSDFKAVTRRSFSQFPSAREPSWPNVFPEISSEQSDEERILVGRQSVWKNRTRVWLFIWQCERVRWVSGGSTGRRPSMKSVVRGRWERVRERRGDCGFFFRASTRQSND